MCQDSYQMKEESKRFLIALLRFHGDIVLITPMIAAIKRLYPDSRIDLLVYKGTHLILEDDTRINEIFEANLSSETGFFKKIVDLIFIRYITPLKGKLLVLGYKLKVSSIR